MRCEEIRELVEEAGSEELNALVRGHLVGCAGCQAYARDWRLARAGFHALREEPVPEASLGFATRLVRRLDDLSETEFLERAGRHFVYATLAVTLLFFLALLAPSSGPLRGPLAADVYLAETQIGPAVGDPIFADDSPALPDAVPVNVTAPGGDGQK